LRKLSGRPTASQVFYRPNGRQSIGRDQPAGQLEAAAQRPAGGAHARRRSARADQLRERKTGRAQELPVCGANSGQLAALAA